MTEVASEMPAMVRVGAVSPPDLNDVFGRGLDIVLSSIAILFLAPLMAAVSLAIWINDGGAVIFSHTRIGRNGRRFQCLKFRSMVRDADAALLKLLETDPAAREEWDATRKLKVDPRITSIGRFLRRSSLDELPQLFNVLRGDMSMVGPRPIVQGEIQLYRRYFRDYCRVRPGITGLWQVSGRNDVSYRRRVAMDVTYTRNKNVALDLALIVATVPAVLLSKGSY